MPSFSPVQRLRGRKWMYIRTLVLRQQPLCADCMAKGVMTEATEVDHIVALVNGGTDDFDNLVGLCTDCHKRKTCADLGQTIKGCDENGVPFSGWK